MADASEILQAARVVAREQRLEDAVALLRRHQAEIGRDPAALAYLGALLTMGGANAEALAVLDRALALDGAPVGALTDRATALARLGRADEADAALDQALALDPDNVPALNNRAMRRLGRLDFEGALADARRVLDAWPGTAPAARCACRALVQLDRPQEALDLLDAQLAGAEPDAANFANHGFALEGLGRYAEARDAYDQAVALAPDEPDHRFARAFVRLRQADFAGGWDDYDRRWSARLAASPDRARLLAALPRLDLGLRREDLVGARVLVLREQGVGDEIMFAQALPQLAADAARVVYAADPRLAALFAQSFPQIEVVSRLQGLDLAAFDRIVPIGGLGAVYRAAPADFPRAPYLRPRPEVVQAWRLRLGPRTTRLRIGVTWRGGAGVRGRRRSLPLEALAPLLDRPDCEFVSLQYGDAAPDVARVNPTLARPIRLFPRADLEDFEQQAALIETLDGVISVQQTTVHLCGALGATCLAMLPQTAEWRYGDQAGSMLWYGDGVRLFRQPQPNDWTPVIDAVAAALDTLPAKASTLPASPPVTAESLRQEALTLARAGWRQDALDRLEQHAAVIADHAPAQALLGTLRAMTGDPASALAAFDRAIALAPNQPVVHSDRGVALTALGRPDEAIEAYGAALALDPAHGPALHNRAELRLKRRQADEALADADAALAHYPARATAHRYRAHALHLLNRPDEALPSIEQSLRLDPAPADSHALHAALLNGAGRFEEGLAAHDAAVARQPAGVFDHTYTRGLARLRLGDFGGWDDYEQRWRTAHAIDRGWPPEYDALGPRSFALSPQDFAGKRVLLVGEQGVGDTIMFAGMVGQVQRLAADTAILVDPRLQSLFAQSFPRARIVADVATARAAPFDLMVPIGGLAHAFRRRAEDFPGAAYLRPRPGTVQAWDRRLGPRSAKLRVGLSWRGGSAGTRRSARSLDLSELTPLLHRDDCEFVSLQYGKVAAEIDAANAALPRPIRHFPREEIENFEHLAGLVQTLDVVVSVQTSLIHLAGAIGAPCLVMIPFSPEWRYGATGTKMPWYNSVDLFRQATPGDWAPVIGAIGDALGRRTA